MGADTATGTVSVNPEIYGRARGYEWDTAVGYGPTPASGVASSYHYARSTIANDNDQSRYGILLPAATLLALALILAGFVVGLLPSVREFGVLFPAGLLLFWIVGAIARRR